MWLRRFHGAGLSGLEELNRAPRRHPNQTPPGIEEAVLELRQANMGRGPRKLKWRLERDWPARDWPATSTIGEIIKRAGLVSAREKRRKTEPYSQRWRMPWNPTASGVPISRAGSRPVTCLALPCLQNRETWGTQLFVPGRENNRKSNCGILRYAAQ